MSMGLVFGVSKPTNPTPGHISVLNVFPTIQNLLRNTYDYWWCDNDKPFPEFFSKSTTPTINHQAKKDRSMRRLEGSLQLTAKYLFCRSKDALPPLARTLPSSTSLLCQACLCAALLFALDGCSITSFCTVLVELLPLDAQPPVASIFAMLPLPRIVTFCPATTS